MDELSDRVQASVRSPSLPVSIRDSRERLTADVVVIGAGIVGASCAYALSRAGLEVHLVERDAPARGASGACEGHLILWDSPTSADLRLRRWSHQRWAELAVELLAETRIDIEYERKGSLMIAQDEEDAECARDKCAWLTEEGIRFEWLDEVGLREAEPALRPDAAAAAYFPADAQIEPRLATAALVRAGRLRGMVIHNHEPVFSLAASESSSAEGGMTVGTLRHLIATPWVVVAAGVGTPRVLQLLGVDLPVTARKGQIAVVAGAPIEVRHIVSEAGYMRTVASDDTQLQIATVVGSTRAGTILLGSSRLMTDPDDRDVDLDVLNRIVSRAVGFFPGLALGRVVRSYAGLRPMSPDHRPIIGPIPAAARVILATGHEGGGVMMAAATGDLVARLIVGGKAPGDLDPFLPGRFFTTTVASH